MTIAEEIAAAAGNLTVLNTRIAASWVPDSGIRSTTDILWSCIVTLTSCIYTAIHLNVPPAHEGRWDLIWRKTKWVGMALFAPELVLFCAYHQFSEARNLVRELNKIRGARGRDDMRLLKSRKFFKKNIGVRKGKNEDRDIRTASVELGQVFISSEQAYNTVLHCCFRAAYRHHHHRAFHYNMGFSSSWEAWLLEK